MNNIEDIGWNFPALGGGEKFGYNNPGIVTFSADRVHHLAREVLQNSLDARLDPQAPVKVTFEIVSMRRDQIPAVDTLTNHLTCCIAECEGKSKKSWKSELTNAIDVLSNDTIDFLKIYDSNTTGLNGDNWEALVKGSGTSVKASDTAGGSHGLGKNATFAVSSLRTVFYWSAFTSSDDISILTEKFQGKSVLMSHVFRGCETQATGFYGRRENCVELEFPNIPAQFRNLDSEKNPVRGTVLWVAGFKGGDGWQTRIASEVVKNFFYAIENNFLDVVIEPDSENQSDVFEISSETLDQCLDDMSKSDQFSRVANRTQLYLDLIRNEPPTRTVDSGLGKYKFWIKLGDYLSRRIALIRETGMLITTEQNQLTRFRNVQDFDALCFFEGEGWNKWLRNMENPQHDQFSADFLGEDERGEGEVILRGMLDELRAVVNETAKKTVSTESEQLDELSRYLPLERSGGPLDLGSEGELGIHEYGSIAKSIPLVPKSVKHKSEDIDVDGEETGEEDATDHTNGDGSGSGNGSNINRRDGENIVYRRFKIEDIRVVKSDDTTNVFELSFTPKESGVIRLTLMFMGDDRASNLCKPYKLNFDEFGNIAKKTLLTRERINVEQDIRKYLTMYCDLPVGNLAWRLIAHRIEL